MLSNESLMLTSKPWYQSPVALNIALLMLLFFIPLSSSLKSIALVASVVLLVIQKCDRKNLNYLFQQSWVKAILIFLTLVLVSSLLSPALWPEKGFVIEKYIKLLWLPFLSLGFTSPKLRLWGLHAFLAAMLITAGVAFCMSLGWVYTDLPAGSVFRNHIITGHMMAFAAYLAARFALENRRWRWGYIWAWAIFTYEILYISQGRTGYIIYFVLATLLILQMFSWRVCLILCLSLGLFAVFTLQFSPIMHQRYQKTLRDVALAKVGRHKTPVGYRLQFQRFSFALLRESPLIGHGTGSFTYYFEQRKPVPGWHKKLREPHNQYWLIAAEYGLLGFFVYLWFLWALFMASFRLKEMKPIALALLVPFILGSFSDSLLFYSGCGYFFLSMMALCMGENIRTYAKQRSLR